MRPVTLAQPVQHDGAPLSPEDYFPVAPDGAIGRVITSVTNKTRSGWKAWVGNEWNVMIALAVIAFLVGGILGLVVVDASVSALFFRGIWQPMEYHGILMVLGGLAGAVLPTLVIVALGYVLRKERMTWVGEQGLQRWEKGIFGVKSEVLRFHEVSSLTTSRTRQYVNGGYSGTHYNYTWWGPRGEKLFVVAGSYREPELGFVRGKPTPAHDPVMFGMAAERGWSRFKIAVIDQELKNTGVARFGSNAGVIRIGRGYVEFEMGGKVERLDRAQIQTATVQQGVIIIKRVGAKEGWFSSEGVFRFPVAGMADFAVFLAIFEEQVGIRMT